MIELIFVLALLAIYCRFRRGQQGSFFGDAPSTSKARSTALATQSRRAVPSRNSCPYILWLHPAEGEYGLTVQSSFADPTAT